MCQLYGFALQRIDIDAETVVLARNLDSFCLEIFNRMVRPVMTEF
jgi:hypothetical protein